MTSSVLLIKIQICVSIMFKNVHVQVSKHETFIYYSMNLIFNKNECELLKLNEKNDITNYYQSHVFNKDERKLITSDCIVCQL